MHNNEPFYFQTWVGTHNIKMFCGLTKSTQYVIIDDKFEYDYLVALDWILERNLEAMCQFDSNDMDPVFL
jgi:hypothetical protein